MSGRVKLHGRLAARFFLFFRLTTRKRHFCDKKNRISTICDKTTTFFWKYCDVGKHSLMHYCNLCKSAIITLCSVQFLNFYFMKIDHMKGNYFKCPLLWAERSTSVCLVSFLWQFPSHCHVWWGVSMSKLLVGLWLPSGSVCLSFSGLLSLILVHSDSVCLTLALSAHKVLARLATP